MHLKTLRYGTLRYATVRYGTLRYATVRYGTLRDATVLWIKSDSLLYNEFKRVMDSPFWDGPVMVRRIICYEMP
jgi:hypothetical protein